ncbi:MAG TPA: MFS transporter [Tessaracoccus flavescens]|uniref:MFS transporter n=1 Tax=Tessaracoccus flavescens TaxID=399497 RepID=A0A921ELJ9_9ACTN|nr:MFS transporter [Tessaracoccus flavescens]
MRALKIPPSTRRFGRVLGNPSVVLMAVTSLLMIGSFAAVEAAMVATFGDGSVDAGLVLAVSSIGSLVGGLLAGNRPLSRWSLALRMMVVVFGFGLATLGTGFWWLAFALFLAGLGIAPALAAVSSVVAGSVAFSDTAEAYGWIGTGQLLGASIGSAVAGIAIDAAGGQGGVVVSFGIAVLSVLVAVIFRKAQPDLSLGILLHDDDS